VSASARHRWNRLEEVLDVVLPLPLGEREARLRALVPDDEALREEARALIAASERAEEALPVPAAGLVGAWLEAESSPLEDVAGRQIGTCELVRELARGGMGIVYEARQHDPDRPVALKILRGGPGGTEELARFREEARALAHLTHPGIATLHEVGTHTSASGEAIPYLVMELVVGAQAITTYAQAHDLPLPARLRLMMQACDAVAAGHQRGVIHRDLKPDNVLVDENGRVKVIDFGLARMIGAEDGRSRALTRTGTVMGTLGYIAPEQLLFGHAHDDVRMDVYALGVIAYELATGQAPIDLTGLDLLRSIRAVAETAPTPASRHLPHLPKDLVIVLGKALEKEPAARYASAEALRDDLAAVLAHQPIRARPPSLRYQAGLFVRRHRVPVAAAGLLLVGLGAATWWSLRAANSEATARAQAESESARAKGLLLGSQQLVHELLMDHYSQLDDLPGSLPARLDLVERVEKGASALRVHAADDVRLLRAAALLQLRLGRINFNRGASHLGRPDAATAAYTRAVEWYDVLLARTGSTEDERRDDGASRASALAGLGELAQDRGDLEEALGHYARAQSALDDLLARWPAHGVVRGNRANLALRRARLLDTMERKAEAIELLADALTRLPEPNADPPPDDVELRTQGNIADLMGELHLLLGHLDAAEAPLARAVTAFDAYARGRDGQPDALRKQSLVATHLGDLELARGATNSALDHYQRALDLDERVLALEPADELSRESVQVDHAKLAEVYAAAGRLPEAIAAQRRAAREAEALVAAREGYLDPLLRERITLHRLAGLLREAGETEEALKWATKAHELATRMVGALPEHPQVRLAMAEVEQGLGLVHGVRAAAAGATDPAASWREAIRLLEASRTAYLAMEADGILPALSATVPAALTQQIQVAQEELARLNGR
jgi:tetratricopeptide (TPR) repeat protein